MWLEINRNSDNSIFNTDNIVQVCTGEGGLYISLSTNQQILINADNFAEAQALFKGFRLVLNGHTFQCGNIYMRLLLTDRNERLHKHIALKEAMSEGFI